MSASRLRFHTSIDNKHCCVPLLLEYKDLSFWLCLSPIHRDSLPTRALTNGTTVVEDAFDFSDDTLMDNAFLSELDAAEQAAMSAVQQRSRDIGQIGSAHPNAREDLTAEATHSEVIVIDSDEDDKENLAPAVQRRVRRRIDTLDPEDSNVIVI